MIKNIQPKDAPKQFVQNYQHFLSQVHHAAHYGVDQAAKYVLNATLPITPLQTNALRNSGKVRSEIDLVGAAASVSFGGVANRVDPTPNAPFGYVDYAIKVHENLYPGQVVFKVGSAHFLQISAHSTQQSQRTLIIESLKEVTS